jgi:hypothetical protein
LGPGIWGHKVVYVPVCRSKGELFMSDLAGTT